MSSEAIRGRTTVVVAMSTSSGTESIDFSSELHARLVALTRRLERLGVHLTSYGNTRSRDSLVDEAQYRREVAEGSGHALSLRAVARALQRVPLIFEAARSYDDGINSYEARADYETAERRRADKRRRRRLEQGIIDDDDEDYDHYMAHGDLLATLLLAGFGVRFNGNDPTARVRARTNA